MIKPRRWPHPGDTALDRARRIAWAYRQALHDLSPDVCARLDAQARHLGEAWVAAVPDEADPDDLYPAARIAELLHIEASRVRKWGSRGVVPVVRIDGGGSLYRLRDCVEQLRRARRVVKDRRDVHNAASG